MIKISFVQKSTQTVVPNMINYECTKFGMKAPKKCSKNTILIPSKITDV